VNRCDLDVIGYNLCFGMQDGVVTRQRAGGSCGVCSVSSLFLQE